MPRPAAAVSALSQLCLRRAPAVHVRLPGLRPKTTLLGEYLLLANSIRFSCVGAVTADSGRRRLNIITLIETCMLGNPSSQEEIT